MIPRAASLSLLLAMSVANVNAAVAPPFDAATLAGDAPYQKPVDLASYAMPFGAEDAQNEFRGRLSFTVEPGNARSELLLDQLKIETPLREYARPPTFDFGFAQVDGRLVPVERGIVAGDGERWDWIVGPGKVWQQGDDGDWSRASVPFALIEKNANCMHHGVLTFRYRGETEVSRVAYQVSQETCRYFQFNAWGAARATRTADTSIDRAAIGAAYRREVARRLPVKPIEHLRKDHPGLDPASFGSAEEIAPRDMTVYGVLIRGVHYSGGCETRHGRYPYCDEMPLPSYSLAKTVMAGSALMRAEALHPGVRRLLVTDYVPECRDAGGWDGVTFENLLDMATGRYDSADTDADENVANTSRFFLSTTHAEKIRIACTVYPRKDPPGKRWVYHTSDTYILGGALSAWWRKEKGPEADFFRDLLVEPVYRRLGLSPEIATSRRTPDDAAQPFSGWGLVLRRDDIVKLGGFLAIGDGKLGKDTLLDPQMVRASLQRDETDTGLPARDGSFRYNDGVYAWNIAEYLGCRKPAWIPFMAGYGGIVVAMLPSGIVYYYVSDGGEFRWARAAAEASRLRSICGD